MVESFGPDVKGSYMNLIFWIDENTFATSLAEKALKSQGVDFYTISSAKDFAYLIKDMKPQIVVIESGTILKDLDLFKAQYESTESFYGAKLVMIGTAGELEFLGDVATLDLPFNPFRLKDFFSKI